MSNDALYNRILEETNLFFQYIYNSPQLQEKYDLINYTNKEAILKVIHSFANQPHPFIIKPLYELDYKTENVPRNLYIERNELGFITCKTPTLSDEPFIVDTFRFTSIIKELIEDESIKKSMYKVAEKENNDINLER